MVITPEELTNISNPMYLNEIAQLENTIDAWCTQNYTGIKGSKLLMLALDAEPRKIVQNKIIEKYQAAGWTLSFEKTEYNFVILIREGV